MKCYKPYFWNSLSTRDLADWWMVSKMIVTSSNKFIYKLYKNTGIFHVLKIIETLLWQKPLIKSQQEIWLIGGWFLWWLSNHSKESYMNCIKISKISNFIIASHDIFLEFLISENNFWKRNFADWRIVYKLIICWVN